MSVSPLTQLSLTAQTVQALLRGETLPEPANYEAYGEYHDLVFRLNLLTAIDPTHAEQLWALESLEAPKLEAMVNGINQEGLVHAADLFPVMKEWYDHGAPKGVSPGWTSLEREYRVLPTEMTVITGTPSAGKALALDTLLPTPSGWTTMGEVSPGDVVFDERGVPCRVLRVTEVMFGRPCFQVTFSDGTTVIADADHQWVTRDEKSRNSHWNAHKRNRLIDRPLLSRGTDQSHKRTYPSVRSTREIADSLWTTGNTPRYNHCVAVAEAMILPETELPIEPYLLGLWLGDGDSKASSITASIEDIPWYLNDIWAAGYYTNLRAGSSPTNGRISVSCVQPRRGHIHGSLKAILRNIGVLRNKHIPLAYLRSSVSQRLALLQGLMDTDGSVSPRSGTCEFTSTNLELANGIVELIVTLGWRVKMKQGKATLRGRAIGPKYRVRFTPDRPVFRLPRKAIFCKSRTPKTKQRQIIAVDPVDSVPVKCIEVDSPTHQYLCTKAFISTHNSRFLTAMLVNIAEHEDWKFLIFSPEMSPPQRHLELVLTQCLGKPFRRGKPGRMTWAEAEEGLQWIHRHFTWLWPKTQPATIPYLLQMAKHQALTTEIKGVVIDPWNRVSHKRGDKELDTAYIGECLGQLSASAQTYGYHQFVVAHPTKVFKDGGKFPVVTPNLISGSANWWNMPENILSVRRDLENDEDNTTEIYIQKIRWDENGRMGRRVDLRYHPETARYSEMVSQTMPYASNGRHG